MDRRTAEHHVPAVIRLGGRLIPYRFERRRRRTLGITVDVEGLSVAAPLRASWREALQLNLHSRLAQRVLVQLSNTMYRNENDLYAAASAIAWEIWFTTRQTFPR